MNERERTESIKGKVRTYKDKNFETEILNQTGNDYTCSVTLGTRARALCPDTGHEKDSVSGRQGKKSTGTALNRA